MVNGLIVQMPYTGLEFKIVNGFSGSFEVFRRGRFINLRPRPVVPPDALLQFRRKAFPVVIAHEHLRRHFSIATVGVACMLHNHSTPCALALSNLWLIAIVLIESLFVSPISLLPRSDHLTSTGDVIVDMKAVSTDHLIETHNTRLFFAVRARFIRLERSIARFASRPAFDRIRFPATG